jgi:septal ring factor EnvC (AmiA/AmiB activator)
MAAAGALPMVGLQIPGAPSVVVPSEQLESGCRDQVQALTEEILRKDAAARAAAARAAARAAQEGARARVSQAARQPGTMPPPPAPMRTVAAPATPAGGVRAWASDDHPA